MYGYCRNNLRGYNVGITDRGLYTCTVIVITI
jgi:hypothetical protein